MAPTSLADIAYLFNHIFLPPYLLQGQGVNTRGHDAHLLKHLLNAAKSYGNNLPASSTSRWLSIEKMIKTSSELRNTDSDSLSIKDLRKTFRAMVFGDVVVLHLEAQNAGLIIRKQLSDVICESFEVTCKADAVLACKGRLLRNYPGPSISIPLDVFDNKQFREEFTSFLGHMDLDVLPRAVDHSITRNAAPADMTSNKPIFISVLLTGILRSVGKPYDAERVTKRIADDVLGSAKNEVWRRSPFWLVMRVALQTTLEPYRTQENHNEYKAFMVYFMTRLIDAALEATFSPSHLRIMTAKVSRRAFKLRENIPEFVVTEAQRVVHAVKLRAETSWNSQMKESLRTILWKPETLTPTEDTRICLKNSLVHITSVLSTGSGRLGTVVRIPIEHPQRLGKHGIIDEDFPTLSEAEKMITLLDMEHWVEHDMDKWARSAAKDLICEELNGIISSYFLHALVAYEDRPENLSLMFLTIIEMWVVLDTLVTELYPLMLDYHPEIPIGFLEGLMLPKKSQMERLDNVEQYIKMRQDNRNTNCPRILSDTVNDLSFTVRFFNESATHQFLYLTIQQRAQQMRNEKKLELAEKNLKYAQLSKRAKSMTCDIVHKDGENYHSSWCRKCAMTLEVQDLIIQKHEWPIPEDQSLARATIFEMDAPKAFTAWRDCTFAMLVNVRVKLDYGEGDHPDDPSEFLQSYVGLQDKYKDHGQVIVWASTTESHQEASYRAVKIPAREEAVCFEHGLQYKFWYADASQPRWVSDSLKLRFGGRWDINKQCTYQLRKGPYKGLQHTLDNTSHTSNDVIAAQFSCPEELVEHEFNAFGTLRAGERLQWLNMYKELKAGVLTLGCEEVNMLFLRAAWQAGTASSPPTVYRETHACLGNVENFQYPFLDTLEDVLANIEGNWLETITVCTLVALASRILSITEDGQIFRRGLDLLSKLRKVSFKWTQEVLKKLRNNDNSEKEISLWQQRALQCSTICRSTFDVEDCHLDNILQNEEQVAIYLECASVVQDNTPPHPRSLTYNDLLLLDRDRRLAHRLERRMKRTILNNRRSLDLALTSLWSAYTPGSSWKVLPKPNDRWVTSTISNGDQNSRAVEVHYNILEGRLLIDKVPFGRLPLLYTIHPTYCRIFGIKIFEVCPANINNMHFQTRYDIDGHQVYFAMRQDQLIIRTRKGTCNTELLPHSIFNNEDLPIPLIEGYTHWLNIRNGDIELRPLESIWKTSKDNWHMRFVNFTAGYHLSHGQGGPVLLDVGSPTVAMIADSLSSLECSQYIIVTAVENENGEATQIKAELPRLKLEFSINPAMQLECKNMRDMVVDVDNQEIGTLYGLRNQLVLRSISKGEQANLRTVLILYGNIELRLSTTKTYFKVNLKKDENVKPLTYLSYSVDNDLGRLVGNGTLLSRLYLAYLHATTSSQENLPDPLLGRSGVEESLDMLTSAASFSFQQLDDAEANLLVSIANLTPARTYASKDSGNMQIVSWLPVPYASQREGFRQASLSILHFWDKLKLLYSKSGEQQPVYKIERGNEHLLQRAALRSGVYNSDLVQKDADAFYEGRDIIIADPEESKIWNLSTRIYTWSPRRSANVKLMQYFKIWRYMKGPIENYSFHLDTNLHIVSLGDSWCSMYQYCRSQPTRETPYRLLFSLSAFTFSHTPIFDVGLLEAMIVFATSPQFRDPQFDLPPYDSYDLGRGFEPTKDQLIEYLTEWAIDYKHSQYMALPALNYESTRAANIRRKELFESDKCQQADRLAQHYLSQWPCPTPQHPGRGIAEFSLLKIESSGPHIDIYFKDCFKNFAFRTFTRSLQTALDSIPISTPLKSEYSISLRLNQSPSSPASIRYVDIFGEAPSVFPAPPRVNAAFKTGSDVEMRESREFDMLQGLVDEFRSSEVAFCRKYAKELRLSVDALKKQHDISCNAGDYVSLHSYIAHYDTCVAYVDQIWKSIKNSLIPNAERRDLGPAQNIMFESGLWPQLTPHTVLKQLNSKGLALSRPWQNTLSNYAIAITLLQRSRRMIDLASSGQDQALVQELTNTGRDGWDPLQRPDWLLMEVENQIIMRKVQAEIASEMLSPSSKSNSLMQLNMGEGKSSVIVPAVAAALADGKKLVRVVVLKPLAAEMFHLLVRKLGGLTNRRVFYIPFNRSVELTAEGARNLQELYQECMKERGILLVQPEHILSFKLIGIERMVYTSPTSAHLLETQRWLDTHSRDILDESDEILQVKYQLIYTVGPQKAMEMHQDRWTIVQQIMEIIKQKSQGILQLHPQGLEIHPGQVSGSFPFTRVLQDDAGQELFLAVARHLIYKGTATVSYLLLTKTLRDTVFKFVTQLEISKEVAEEVRSHFSDDDMWKTTLLLRGLFAHNILFFAFKEKRWRVDYGLDTKRTLLAVPYKAKDTPGVSDFAHPDIVLTLTCLTYYYTGLTEESLILCFEMLYKFDNPALEYEQFIKDCVNVPPHLQELKNLNIQDKAQRKNELLPLFQHNKHAIDFFLGQYVFPKQAKEFEFKLATSGWDIAEKKTHVSTGFSGTNDNRYLLPTDISQQDMPNQLHTNAKVIRYMLQPENDHFISTARSNGSGERMTVLELLKRLASEVPSIKVLLDVGAQVLEFSNAQVAQTWLSLVPDDEVQAALYFNEKDEMTVVTRDGSIELFMTSAFAKKLDRCLIYLDDAHTRGTDLKLPIGSRAAVTLGPKTTKDRLSQGVMRMRKLGVGHSIVFCAPQEIQASILKLAGKQRTDRISAVDILRYTMTESCNQTEKNVELWAQQGLNYQIRKQAWLDYNISNNEKSLLAKLLEQESKPLKELYNVHDQGENIKSLLDEQARAPGMQLRKHEIEAIYKKCQEFGVASFKNVRVQEEQEREVAHEVEVERQIERPEPKDALKHGIATEVSSFVKTGSIPKSSAAFMPAFETLQQTSLAPNLRKGAWTSRLMATRDFADTVKLQSFEKQDDYIRPVSYILSSNKKIKSKNKKYEQLFLVIISPFEANQLLPALQTSKRVKLHLYTPKVINAMQSFEDLKFCPLRPIPKSWKASAALIDQLNLFAGQLYFRSYKTYIRTAEFLGIYTRECGETDVIEPDGFVHPLKRFYEDGETFSSPFKTSPVPFLKQLYALRRRGQKFLPTHVGQMLNARLLDKDDFAVVDEDDFEDDGACSAVGSDTELISYVEDEEESGPAPADDEPKIKSECDSEEQMDHSNSMIIDDDGRSSAIEDPMVQQTQSALHRMMLMNERARIAAEIAEVNREIALMNEEMAIVERLKALKLEHCG